MKQARQKKILELIKQHPIERQEELLQYLTQAGFPVTQATVSRDIRELQLIKASGNDGYRYVCVSPAGAGTLHSQSRFEMIFRESVLKCDYAGHTVLVKCFSGMANAACELFDSMEWEYDVVGTLSGDDTFLILMRTEEDANKLCQALSQYIVSR
ncbi:MAG: arginine repressor [Candidatus Fournierella pullistercoris]|uniref:Arginine repressor n=1 Tax=Candidatus Allofournierella pullistercoris TaxID=2838597 RepID=A0A948WR90_9FIRM|nr:arginine repressor [Candidatus Fournierella pullistercoris]